MSDPSIESRFEAPCCCVGCRLEFPTEAAFAEHARACDDLAAKGLVPTVADTTVRTATSTTSTKE